ncbi:MAG: GNAT family N-acetyltransferase [Acidimicrobiales bacterium]
MYIRREQRGDEQAVHAVHTAAFRVADQSGETVEAGLADELRRSGAALPELSVVAVIDGEVVGHVVCSRGWVEATTGDRRPALGLGPLGVLPDHQDHGIGKALMHAVLGAADALDEPLVALLGEPAYYGRFGFEPSHRHGVEPPDPAWGDYFQVRTLTAYDPSLRGTFHYALPFDGL